ncbi:MAG: MBL fold metallo-hydrolase [Gammaproteobacteria bacterium]|nr:MBL fold metallo-hydrolase [Gammaproteobacteria bacterium]NIR88859.1 MBL fold metallo-hydrolase [Gammaproteobacteria bacterium]NIU06463.1 MBL fold metallo-hydrolase [Gammaproteobacteria bacterium]NIV53355.1 MBL fold metallo-hydrolase [Gammaproteobacteria bacterium]NIV74074.1 MBL fold metallo-hydrolase [Gammaproteobacteria bacterium]
MVPVAEPWFRVLRYDDGISRICEPHIVARTRCNMWHVRGRDRDLLVDSGFGVVSLRNNVAFLSERQVLAVATHTHFDHIGGHYEFAQRAVHPLEAGILAHPTRHNTVIDVSVTDATFTAYPKATFDPDRYSVRSAPATSLIDDGDVIDLGNRHFEVFHLPGHSPGSIVLWESVTGTLFAGDVVYDGPLSDQLYHSDSEVYVDSMRRLRQLPVRVVHGGHYESFGRELFLEIIDAYIRKRVRS